ncbi:MAG: hypothetical protein AB7V27_01050 [Candidatus Binatia bacterium]
MKIIGVYANWIHTHFVTDGQQLPTARVREIERGVHPVLRELGIVFGIHLEREKSDPGIRIVLECRPCEPELDRIRARLAEVVKPIPTRPPTTIAHTEHSQPEPAATRSRRPSDAGG